MFMLSHPRIVIVRLLTEAERMLITGIGIATNRRTHKRDVV